MWPVLIGNELGLSHDVFEAYFAELTVIREAAQRLSGAEEVSPARPGRDERHLEASRLSSIPSLAEDAESPLKSAFKL
mgnify:CR=1 FL=1